MGKKKSLFDGVVNSSDFIKLEVSFNKENIAKLDKWIAEGVKKVAEGEDESVSIAFDGTYDEIDMLASHYSQNNKLAKAFGSVTVNNHRNYTVDAEGKKVNVSFVCVGEPTIVISKVTEF